MNKWNRPINLIPFVTAPHLAAVLSVGYCLNSGILPRTAAIFALMGAMIVTAIFALICAFVKRTQASLPPPLTLALLIATAAVFGAMIATVYPIPQPTQALSIEVGLMLLGAVSISGLVFTRCTTGAFRRKDAMFYGFVLPMLCALGFSLPRSVHMPNDIALCLAVGLLCLSAMTFILPFLPAVAGQDKTEAQPAQKLSRFRSLHKSMPFVSLFAIVLPLVGLSLSNSTALRVNMGFESPWFYIIAALNGALMLPIARSRFELPLFYLKAVGLGFIAYFTLIFLPFTLIGVIGLLVVLGVLLLTPLTVFVVQLAQLRSEYRSLLKRHGQALLLCLLTAGVLTLPAVVLGNMAVDRMNYGAALASVTQGEPSARVDQQRLSRTLTKMNAVNSQFESSLGRTIAPESYFHQLLFSYPDTPILSRAYNAIVFGDQPLSKTRATALYQAYFETATGVQRPDLSSWAITQSDFELTSVGVRSEYDDTAAVYRSWVDLTIRNTKNIAGREFQTDFTLGRDCFVTDYSLFVGHQNKRGLLSERRAATAVYDSIVNTRRDPGMVRYLDRDTLRLNVFPFAPHETRKTSFQVTHAAPVTLTIEGHAITLNAPDKQRAAIDLGAHTNCAQDTCDEQLPYVGDAYQDAARLLHNATVDPDNLEHVRKAFEMRILTPGTAFIVLETAQQEAALRALQERVMNGEPLPDITVSMSEPGPVIILLACGALLLLRKRRRTQSAAGA